MRNPSILCKSSSPAGQKGQARELLNLGLILVKKGDFTSARQMYDEAFQFDQRAGDKNGMAAVMGDTGILLRIQGRLHDALNHFQHTLDLSNEVGHGVRLRKPCRRLQTY
jgi:tetratricopeptide (TPR) repeat protein